MIDTLLFDLDGTLLGFTQAAFIEAYFAELRKVFDGLGLDSGKAVKAVWAGTKAMTLNDGAKPNALRFWETFGEFMGISGERLASAESACDAFYSNEFDVVKRISDGSELPKRAVLAAKSKGYDVILATNPLFPECAVTTRLNWVGLLPGDFSLVTHYSNSSFCKPNTDYYREIFTKTGKIPQQCLMVGNNPAEDMCAGTLGCETFLVTDYLENEAGVDIGGFRRGTMEDLAAYVLSLPEVSG